LGDKHCLKQILDGFKAQNSSSKVEKCQNILHFIELENVLKNALGVRFRGANGLYLSYSFACLIYGLSGYRTTSQNIILAVNTASKRF